MSQIVIFGTGEIAQLAYFYFTHDSSHEVAAFTVDSDFMETDSFCDLPVIPFDNLEENYSPSNFQMFVAISYAKINRVRAEKYAQAKSKGYSLVSYVSTKATSWNDLNIGDNCFILEDNTIQPFAKIGNNVILWSGNHIGHHVQIGNHCFITSHVVISGGVTIQEHCFVGVNATIRDHVNIAPSCVIGAGGLILENTVENGVYTIPSANLSKVPSHRLRKL